MVHQFRPIDRVLQLPPPLGPSLGLPLQLWNAKALEVIGNALGHFIKVDEQALLYADKRMDKVLVEVDIHA
jgi:hypothetical protein